MKAVLGKIKKYSNAFLAIVCAILLSFMAFLVLWQVFTRYVLQSPAAFTEELVKYSLIWTSFVGAAYAFSAREHMALTLIKDRLQGIPQRILATLIDLLIFAVALFVITIGGFKLAASAHAEFSALLGIPRTLVYAIAPISGLFIMFFQLINIYEDITGVSVEDEIEEEVKS